MAEHKLNEQWVEVIDGKRHMLKAVEGGEHWCDGCCFNTGVGNCSWDSPKYCRNGSEYRIKDLGILNEDGCLPSPWGGYPKIVRLGSERFCTYKVRFYLNHEGVWGSTLVEFTGNTRQEAIDAWNRGWRDG